MEWQFAQVNMRVAGRPGAGVRGAVQCAEWSLRGVCVCCGTACCVLFVSCVVLPRCVARWSRRADNRFQLLRTLLRSALPPGHAQPGLSGSPAPLHGGE